MRSLRARFQQLMSACTSFRTGIAGAARAPTTSRVRTRARKRTASIRATGTARVDVHSTRFRRTASCSIHHQANTPPSSCIRTETAPASAPARVNSSRSSPMERRARREPPPRAAAASDHGAPQDNHSSRSARSSDDGPAAGGIVGISPVAFSSMIGASSRIVATSSKLNCSGASCRIPSVNAEL